MVNVSITVKGISSLIMHRFSYESNQSSSRGKKVYIPEEEAEKASYRNSEGKLFLPSSHFKASLVKASADYKLRGHKTYKDYVRAGVFLIGEEIILDNQIYSIKETPVVIQRSRVIAWRPEFKEWGCSFNVEIVDEQISPAQLKNILESAGKYHGVGDWRPEHGRFVVTKFDVVKDISSFKKGEKIK